MPNQRESIQSDTPLDLESILNERDMYENIEKRRRFIKLYISLILLSNLIVLVLYQEISISDTFLLSGITNFTIPGFSIVYYYSGQGTNQDFIRASSGVLNGGLVTNMALVENEVGRRKTEDQSNLKIINISATIYLFTIPMILGVFLIIFGFFFL